VENGSDTVMDENKACVSIEEMEDEILLLVRNSPRERFSRWGTEI
jgi:hypothetical protein